MKEEIVYYAYRNTEAQTHGFLHGQEPRNAKQEFVQGLEVPERIQVLRCPAFMDALSNVFSVPSLFDFNVTVEGSSIKSAGTNLLPQEFFDSYVTNHSPEDKLYGLQQNIMFVAESDSLEMTQEHPSMVDTTWARDVYTVPGKLDIGKYFRTLECAWFIRKGVKELNLNEGDALYYARFHTTKKIKLVPFHWSPAFEELVLNMKFLGPGTHKWKPLQFYYDAVKKRNIKKLVMKEIKNNLMN